MNKRDKKSLRKAAMDGAAAQAAANEGFVTKDVVAFRLKKTERTVERWMALGYIPFLKTGHSVLYNWKAIVDHLTRNYGKSSGAEGGAQA